MGYYADRLRQRLGRMSKEEKDNLWNKLSDLSEMGPVVTGYKVKINYIANCEPLETNPYPPCYQGDINNKLAT